MAKIKDWLVPFLTRYRARLLPHDWPDPSPGAPPEARREWVEFLKGWQTPLALMSVTEAEADAALDRLTLAPPRYRKDHLPALLAVVERIRSRSFSPSAAQRDPEGTLPPEEETAVITGLAARPEADPFGGWARRRLEKGVAS